MVNVRALPLSYILIGIIQQTHHLAARLSLAEIQRFAYTPGFAYTLSFNFMFCEMEFIVMINLEAFVRSCVPGSHVTERSVFLHYSRAPPAQLCLVSGIQSSRSEIVILRNLNRSH